VSLRLFDIHEPLLGSTPRLSGDSRRRRPISARSALAESERKARPVAPQPGMPAHDPKLRHHRPRQPGTELVQEGADDFRNRQDGFDDDGEELDDLRRP